MHTFTIVHHARDPHTRQKSDMLLCTNVALAACNVHFNSLTLGIDIYKQLLYYASSEMLSIATEKQRQGYKLDPNAWTIFEKSWNCWKLRKFFKILPHRIDLLMNELQNESKFKDIKECIEGTCNHVQGLFPCRFHVHRVMAVPSSWPTAKELGKNCM